MFAMKDKLDLSLGVAIGSSIQISMFVMDLNFQLFETDAVHHRYSSSLFLQEGTWTYFKGLMLILCYLIVAASFFVHKDFHEDISVPKRINHTLLHMQCSKI